MSQKRDDEELADLQPLEKLEPLEELEPMAELEPMELEPLEELQPLEELEPAPKAVVPPPAKKSAPAKKPVKPVAKKSAPKAPAPKAAPKAPAPKAAAPKEGVLEEIGHEVEGGVLPDLVGEHNHPPTLATPPDEAKPAAAVASAGAGSGEKSSRNKEKFPEGPIKAVLGERRELEVTPLMLRKAAKILFVGALFPWLVALKAQAGVPVPWAMLFAGKAVVLIGAFFIHQGVIAGYGGEVKKFVQPLAKAHRMALTYLGLVIALSSFAVVWGQPGLNGFAAVGEMFTLLLATWTFSHIQGYEYGARFNPMFPFMFLGPAAAGALSVIGAAAQFGSNPGLAVVGLIGCLLCAAGGIMAIYSLVLAMKQAKVEGEIKKRQMMEHRKAMRAAKRDAQGGQKPAAGN